MPGEIQTWHSLQEQRQLGNLASQGGKEKQQQI